MFFKKKNEKENIQDQFDNTSPRKETEEEIEKLNPKPIIKIIDGKLYDTSKVTHVCDLRVWYEKKS